MKMKRIVAVVLATLLVLAGGGALAEVADTMTTEVNVTFVEAVYFYDFPEGGGMDVDFGEQPLPGGTVLIPAPDGIHTLRVCDRRATAGGWSVSAKYTTHLASGGENIGSVLYLLDPTWSDGLTPKLSGPYATPPFPPELKLIGFNMSSTKIVDAASGLTPGNYDVTWALGNTRLYLSADEAKLAKPQAYSTTILWTLTLTPDP